MASELDSDLSSHVSDSEAEMDHLDTSENSASSSENEFDSDDMSDKSDNENSIAAAHVCGVKFAMIKLLPHCTCVWREVCHDEVAPPLHMCGMRFAMMKPLPQCTCVV